MALTRDFKDTIKARAARDPEFREALLVEGIECLLSGDVETGKTVLRDYINATVGFPALAKAVDKQPESLMRMLSPSGNPSAGNIFAIIRSLQMREGVELHVQAERVGA
ncbi:transcriptional regulator [bacterium]|nr:transcriptional regulator [bacterium]